MAGDGCELLMTWWASVARGLAKRRIGCQRTRPFWGDMYALSSCARPVAATLWPPESAVWTATAPRGARDFYRGQGSSLDEDPATLQETGAAPAGGSGGLGRWLFMTMVISAATRGHLLLEVIYVCRVVPVVHLVKPAGRKQDMS